MKAGIGLGAGRCSMMFHDVSMFVRFAGWIIDVSFHVIPSPGERSNLSSYVRVTFIN